MAKGKASTIELGVEERRELERLVRGRLMAQALAMRARIVLAAAEGETNDPDRRAAGGVQEHGGPLA